MAGLRLYTSNRLEILADSLAEILEHPLASPLDREIIVVQSRGMERWLSLQLARRHGVCANVHFPFPNHFIQTLFNENLRAGDAPDLFDTETLTWVIMKHLPDCLTLPGFEDLRNYLRAGHPDLKALQLSRQIADTFDQYLIFRPDLVFHWEAGREDHWQARLWRRLVRELGANHRAALGRAFLEAVKTAPPGALPLPERISVFGISALPRFHMGLLAAVASRIPVHLFLINPCREYWGDILSRWEMRRAERRMDRDTDPAALHLEKGNGLLASLGTLGREFFDLIHEFPFEDFPSFQEPDDGTLLGAIQSHILNLNDPQDRADGKIPLRPDDSSLQIHACHSPMREIEVLHDQLLHMFEADPGLAPREILVMAPDVEAYAPYVQAVFDLPRDDARRIPFSVADQSVSRESEIIQTFFSILDLQAGRFGAAQVMAILEAGPVRRRFGVSEAELEAIRGWVRDTRIRWGIDEQDRAERHLPPFPENTWQAGLERLLLGYALPGSEEQMFADRLPYDRVEGGEALVLGRLARFIDRLSIHLRVLSRPRSLGRWTEALMALLDELFLADEDNQREMQVLRRILTDLGRAQARAGPDRELDIRAIRWHLAHCLEREGLGYGFMTGRVTFCSMLPMRSIPFRVICLVGMNHDAYPRRSRSVGFDLMAQHPRPGDRSRRNDDRYLFLEALLSARKTFYMSYVGQSLRDNSPIPPSVLVSELMDYVGAGFDTGGVPVRERLVTRHRLQAFSPAYFQQGRLFTYARENLEAALALTDTGREPTPFISSPLPDPDPAFRSLDVEDMIRFFVNPCRFLLMRRLGIQLHERSDILEEREAFRTKGLERYLLASHLLGHKLHGRDLTTLFAPARASGGLPHGTVGKREFEALRHGVEVFAHQINTHVSDAPLPPVEVDLPLSGFRLYGRLSAIYPEGLLRYRYARVKARDRLRVWIYHLVLNSLPAHGYPRDSLLAGLDPAPGPAPGWAAWHYPPIANSREILLDLLEKYWAGLTRPLRFFPASSWAYASAREKDKSPGESLGRALREWEGSPRTPGEGEDAAYRICFGEAHPLDELFQTTAEAVFAPVVEHEREITR